MNFFKTKFSADEGQPVKHPVKNSALVNKFDWNVSTRNQLAVTYNFTRSNKENETFDVRSYGMSANGVEGPAHIQPFNVSFNTVSLLEQVGPLNTNGAIAGGNYRDGTFPLNLLPQYPKLLPPDPGKPFSPSVRVFAKDFKNPRNYTANIAMEREFYPNWVAYTDFTWSKGVYLTRFINANNPGPDLGLPVTGDTHVYGNVRPFGELFPFGDIATTSSSAKSLYRGWTSGMRKRFANRFQLEWNYVLSWDYDDDSNERDPFTFRYFNYYNFKTDYSYSDRDIRHKFNLFGFAQLPGGFEINGLLSVRSAQPITPSPRVVNSVDRGRNSIRKDNAYSSFDWRLQRPFKFRDQRSLILLFELFNTFNSKNNLAPQVTNLLFNFDGFLRSGIGDPLTAQLGVKFRF